MANFINRLLIVFHYIYFFIFPIYLLNLSTNTYYSDFEELAIILIPLIFLFSFIKYCLSGKMVVFPWSDIKKFVNIKHRNYSYFLIDFLHFVFVYFSLTFILLVLVEVVEGKFYANDFPLILIFTTFLFYLGPILKFLFQKSWVVDPFKISNSKEKDTFLMKRYVLVGYLILFFLLIDFEPVQILKNFLLELFK